MIPRPPPSFPPLPLHSEPAHSCAGCLSLGHAARRGEIEKRPFCHQHITPFRKCAHYTTGRPSATFNRESGA